MVIGNVARNRVTDIGGKTVAQYACLVAFKTQSTISPEYLCISKVLPSSKYNDPFQIVHNLSMYAEWPVPLISASRIPVCPPEFFLASDRSQIVDLSSFGSNLQTASYAFKCGEMTSFFKSATCWYEMATAWFDIAGVGLSRLDCRRIS